MRRDVRADPAWRRRAIAQGDLTNIDKAIEGNVQIVQRLADIGELVIRRCRAGHDLYGVLVFFPANRVAIRPAVRDHQQQRLAAELKAAL